MKSKLLSILLSIAIAFGLWIYVINVVSPGSTDTIYDIPLTLVGDTVLENERNLMITSDVEDLKVDLTLSGNRSDLTQVNAGNITLRVDLSKIYEPGTHKVEYTESWPGSVASNAFTIESRYPESLTITVERLERKEVPVHIQWVGSTPEEYISDRENARLDHPYIFISGPKTVVDQITQARITVDLEGRVESLDQNFRYTLCNDKGEPVDAQMITVNTEEVNLKMPILLHKEVNLTVTIVDGGGATAETSTWDILPKTIKIAGTKEQLAGIEELNLGTIRLAEQAEDTRLTFPVTLPEGVVNLSGVSEATVDLRFPQLSTKTFYLSDVTMVGLPEGLEALLDTQQIHVIFRGPSANMRKLGPSHITLEVDLSEAKIGTDYYVVNVTLAEGFESVGVLKKVPVSITIQETDETT